MNKKMLIDAAHPEETRVVVVQDNRIEEFDFESSTKTLIRGNIYLAKVTRIEPSLQAAFVEYGGNRHGFLAFNEIHPDYYQIPVSDRQALLDAEAEEERALALKEREEDDAISSNGSKSDAELTDEDDKDEESAHDASAESSAHEPASENDGSDEEVESYAEARRRRRQKLRQYKIQEVIKRRQIILVQVAKEERGNKGAALTTYLSLAGRYCVLMPNTARGGGISRKISNATDRRQLRKIIESLEVPQGMGLIIRTAGSKRTKTEIKRDYEYLLRLWENVRSLTLESMAPSLVHEEGSLIKRSIRDLYTKEIDTVLVEGDASYREAKDFMRMLMPSHARNVKKFSDNYSIFQKFKIESQLDAMFNPQVPLRSGGYLVINPTEALVSIDVNSGRSTRERNIENTALRTNLEAAEEVARQCRLRDLAGLIVIDFIDMEENRNNRSVEKRLKDSLKNDRARVQLGRISSFGLLEMSRQRMRSGVLEGSTSVCPACDGAGVIRSTESTTLSMLRTIEDHSAHGDGQDLLIRAPAKAGLYLLNNKKGQLLQIESQGHFSVNIEIDNTLSEGQFEIVKRQKKKDETKRDDAAKPKSAPVDSDTEHSARSADEEQEEKQTGQGKSKRRRRRRKPKEDKAAASGTTESSVEGPAESADSQATTDNNAEASPDQDTPKRRRPRGRRGGRRNKNRDAKTQEMAEPEKNAHEDADSASGSEHTPGKNVTPLNGDDQTISTAQPAEIIPVEESKTPLEARPSPLESVFSPEPEATRAASSNDDVEMSQAPTPDSTPPHVIEDNKPKKSGWWKR